MTLPKNVDVQQKLGRFLHSRPSPEDLKSRNILHQNDYITSASGSAQSNIASQTLSSSDSSPIIEKTSSKEKFYGGLLRKTKSFQNISQKESKGSKLKIFLSNRPAKEQLEARNIIQSNESKKSMLQKRSQLNKFFQRKLLNEQIIKEPLFGVSLSELFERAQAKKLSMIPLIELCVQHLKSTALDEVGLFRESGSLSEVASLQTKLENGETPDFLALHVSPHSVATLLKRFLREMPEALIPSMMQTKFMSILDIKNPEEKVKFTKELISQLPVAHRLVFMYIMEYLHELSQHSSKNMMTANNIGIIFGPTVMKTEMSSFLDQLASMPRLAQENGEVIAFIVENYKALQ